MTTCSTCNHEKKIFTFQNYKTTFEAAQVRCSQAGGKLAQDLDASTYAAFLRCCPDRKSYWIGLKNVQCGNKRSSGYQWIGSKTCNDGSPLNLEPQPVNNNECKAVAIELYRSDHNRKVPRARVQNCNNANINYICQKEKFNTTITGITTSSYEIQSLSSVINTQKKMLTANQNFDSTPKSNMKSFKNDLFENCKGLTDWYSSQIGASIGGAVGFNVFVLMLLIVLFCLKKRKLERNFRNSLSKPHGSPQNQIISATYLRFVVYLHYFIIIHLSFYKYFEKQLKI